MSLWLYISGIFDIIFFETLPDFVWSILDYESYKAFESRLTNEQI